MNQSSVGTENNCVSGAANTGAAIKAVRNVAEILLTAGHAFKKLSDLTLKLNTPSDNCNMHEDEKSKVKEVVSTFAKELEQIRSHFEQKTTKLRCCVKSQNMKSKRKTKQFSTGMRTRCWNRQKEKNNDVAGSKPNSESGYQSPFLDMKIGSSTPTAELVSQEVEINDLRGSKQLSKLGDYEGDKFYGCTICLKEITDEAGKIQLQCFHSFHIGCIAQWMVSRSTCPVCFSEMEV